MTSVRAVMLLGILLAGCVTHVPSTEVVVVVEAEASIARDVRQLHVTVLGGARGTTLTSQADQTIGGPTAPIAWPVTIALAPAAGDTNRLFEIEGTATDTAGATLGVVRARSSYVANHTVELRLALEECCRTIASSCSADQTCRSCMCTSADVPPSSLPDYTSSDGGTSGDGGGLVSTGADGAFAPTSSVVLPSGVYNFTTITVPAGVVVRVDDGGLLDLRATGEVMIAGDIDVSGGRGASVTSGANGGGGGSTATGVDGVVGSACGGAGGGGAPSGGGPGTAGGAAFPATIQCVGGAGTNGGGGGGGYSSGDNGGGGGGGYAGGGGGASADRGVGWGQGGPGGWGVAPSAAGLGGVPAGHGAPAVASGGVPYDGSAGGDAAVLSGGSAGGGGGAGGAIAPDAVSDLAMATTFRSGSGGGGGGSWAGGGGGGGGGAIRITTPSTLTVSGRVLARGGNGGDGGGGTAAGGGGGGGSGGAIILSAAALAVTGEVHASGGAAGTPNGGAGGLGRIRLDVGSGSCSVAAGTFDPPLHDRCSASSLPGFAYVVVSPKRRNQRVPATVIAAHDAARISSADRDWRDSTHRVYVRRDRRSRRAVVTEGTG